MSKKKKNNVPAKPKRAASKSIPQKRKRTKAKLWLNKNGTVNRKKKTSKYLTQSGRLDKRRKLPKGVRSIGDLYEKFYPSKKSKKKSPSAKSTKAKSSKAKSGKPRKVEEWQFKNGKYKPSIAKYLTKDGKLNKRYKYPKGVRTAKDLWEYLQSGKIKPLEDERANCVQYKEPYWEVREKIDQAFFEYKAVYMGGIKISIREWFIYSYQYTNENKNILDSPPSLVYTICDYGIYKYLFI